MTELEYYKHQLIEQISLLIDACHLYDMGKFHQAKTMSSIIRTLVKDPENPKPNNQTISLLKSLSVKESMKFFNTGYEAVDPLININLIGIVTVPTLPPLINDKESIYLPLLNSSELIDCKWLTFDQWWKSKVIIYKSENLDITFTRKKIVLTMAEQDGGAHIDNFKNINKSYRNLITGTTHLFTTQNLDGSETGIKHIQYALVRQISHELIISIKKQFNLINEYNPSNKFNLRGVPENQIKQFGVFAEAGKHLSIRTQNPYKCTGFSSFKTPPNAAYVKLQF